MSDVGVWISEAIDENPEEVRKIENEGRFGYVGFLLGQVMKKSSGKADAQEVKDALHKIFPPPDDGRIRFVTTASEPEERGADSPPEGDA